MRHRFVRFLLLSAALWLPVQTMAAMSMPLCRHAPEHGMASVMTEQSAAGMPCHEAHDAVVQDQAAHDAGCDNCEMCHLAGCGFMPSALVATGLIPAEHQYVLPATVAPPSHIAEPPQHPPRSSA
ncbi:MAG: hypothetical protein NT042_04475 [Sulfuritalea sp.]|nr:hypothetical protein [Sulfuritalea sp.]